MGQQDTKAVSLFERIATGGRVDRDAGVILGVKVLGLESNNGRRYEPDAVKAAVGLYEGCKVCFNHPTSPEDTGPRQMEDVAGWLRNVHFVEGQGLVGDLHLITSDQRSVKVLEAAEKNPALFGLSHNVRAVVARRDNVTVVDRIEAVRSVDIVCDPATTQSLFESEGAEMEPNDSGAMAPASDPLWDTFCAKSKEIWNATDDPKARAKQIAAMAAEILKVKDSLEAVMNGGKKADAPAEGVPAEEACAKESTEAKPDPNTVAVLEAKLQAAESRAAALELLSKKGLPHEAALVEAVSAVSSDKREALIESLSGLRGSNHSGIISRGKPSGQGSGIDNGKDFAKAVLGRN